MAGCGNNPQKELCIVFGGDAMLGRLVNEVINQKGHTYPWGDILPLLQKADFRIVNLETTLTTSTKKVPKVFNYKTDPQNVRTLMAANINLVSLANNHSKDFDDEGLLETITVLDQAHISHVGAGKDIVTAQKPVIMEINNIKIGIVGATDNEPTWQATETNPGINYFSVDNLSDLLHQIRQLKKQVDIAIVSLHWGPNMRQRPTKEYVDAAHLMIDAGTDIIHGHSAHIFQGIEIYKNKLIMYDTGDLVDDYQVDPALRNDQSFIFLVTVDKKGVKRVDLTPLLISDMQVNTAPGKEKTEIMEKIKRLSAELGTVITDEGQIVLR